jgi:hypothetical protein
MNESIWRLDQDCMDQSQSLESTSMSQMTTEQLKQYILVNDTYGRGPVVY